MTSVLVDASIVELGVANDQWQGFREALTDSGYTVAFTVEQFAEQRSRPDIDEDWEFIATRVIVTLAGKALQRAADEVVGDIVAAAKRHLRGRIGGRKRRLEVEIHNPRGGEPLSTVVVEIEEDEADASRR